MAHATSRFDTRVISGTGALVVLLLLTAGTAFYATAALNSNFANTITVTARAQALASQINTAMFGLAAGARGMLLYRYAKNPERAAASEQLYDQNEAKVRKGLAEIMPLLANARHKEMVTSITAAVESWAPAYAEAKRLASTGDNDGGTQVIIQRITPSFTASSKTIAELIEAENQAMQTEQRACAEQTSAVRWVLILVVMAGLAVGIYCFWQVRRALNGLRRSAAEILDGARQLRAASSQIASSSQSVAQGASEQAASLEETSSSASEITAVTRKNAENTRAVARLMTESAGMVERANRSLDEMVQSMKGISGSSEKISKIIRVIDEIAFQTNILALNAAVEAARAGEAGLGFAVVADEVRNLAQRSAQAAKDTASLIEESIATSGSGSTKLDHVATSIRQFTDSAGKVKTLVDEVDVGSQDQARGIEQIATAVEQMQQVTQRVAANSEQSAEAGQQLAAQAENLYSIVERLRGLLGALSDQSSVEMRATSAGGGVSRGAGRPLAAPMRAAQTAPAARAAVPETRAEFPLDEGEGDF